MIRECWGNEKYYKNFPMKRIFIFGVEKSDTKNVEILQKEHAEFDDILLGDFIDHFHNLTFKDSIIFTWAENHCESKFLFKGRIFN